MINEAIKAEPNPVPGKQNVMEEIIKDLNQRTEFGIKKYGTPLQTHNGRDSLVDAYQEALDLVQYLKQALMEREGKIDILVVSVTNIDNWQKGYMSYADLLNTAFKVPYPHK